MMTDQQFTPLAQRYMDTIFRLPGVLSDELALTREGDRVRIGYAPQQAGSVTGSEFDNLAMAQGA